MTAPTTDNRPTDTIRDAFEAMLWYLACLIGPLRPRKITPAEEVGALAACEVETDFEPDDPPAPLLAFRDLIQRAAEEHNRRTAAAGDFTPERIREALERCDALRVAIEKMTTEEGTDPAEALFDDIHDLATGGQLHEDHEALIDEHRDLVNNLRATFRAAREDLPAALAEIERLTAELAARAPADAPSLARARAVTRLLALGLDGQEVAHLLADAASIVAGRGRLTSPGALAILADYVAPADASLEARAKIDVRTAADIVSDLIDFAETREWSDRVHDYGDYFYEGCEACEARESDGEHGPRCTRKALFLEARAFIDAERSAVVRAVDASRPAAPAIERTLNVNALARCARAALRIEVPDVAAWEALPEAERVGWRAVVRCVLASTTPASRPGLTEEQAQTARFEPVIAAWLAYFDAMDRQNASGTAADAQIVRELRATANGMDRIVADVVYHVALARHRASRGETGPAPAGLTRAMHDAQQRRSEPPDPRATLRDGDPAKIERLNAEIERLTAELAALRVRPVPTQFADGSRPIYVPVCRDCGAEVERGQPCKAVGCPPYAAAAPVREIGAPPADFASMHDADTHPHRPDPISLGERGPWDEEDRMLDALEKGEEKK